MNNKSYVTLFMDPTEKSGKTKFTYPCWGTIHKYTCTNKHTYAEDVWEYKFDYFHFNSFFLCSFGAAQCKKRNKIANEWIHLHTYTRARTITNKISLLLLHYYLPHCVYVTFKYLRHRNVVLLHAKFTISLPDIYN